MKKLLLPLLLISTQAIAAYPDESNIWSDIDYQNNQKLYSNSNEFDQKNIIPVCWVDFNESELVDRVSVQDQITNTWEKHGQFKFVGWDKQCTDSDVGYRIRVSDELMPSHTIFVGKPLDWYKSPNISLNFNFTKWNQQCLFSYTRDFCIRSVAMHEFGHALGLVHEQERDDAPPHCWYLRQQYAPKGTTVFNRYDERSVMNYCNVYYQNNGVLSDSDILFVKVYYGNIPYLNVSENKLVLTDVVYLDKHYNVTMKDIGGEFKVVDSFETLKRSSSKQTFDGSTVEIELGAKTETKIIDKSYMIQKIDSSVKSIYSVSLQRLQNGNFVFTKVQKID